MFVYSANDRLQHVCTLKHVSCLFPDKIQDAWLNSRCLLSKKKTKKNYKGTQNCHLYSQAKSYRVVSYTCAGTLAPMNACTHAHTHTHKHTHTHPHSPTHPHTHTDKHPPIHTHTNTHISTHPHTHKHEHIHPHTHKHRHRHKHTHKHPTHTTHPHCHPHTHSLHLSLPPAVPSHDQHGLDGAHAKVVVVLL